MSTTNRRNRAFRIETPIGAVAGFEYDLGMVQVAGAPGYERKFPTRAAAQKFLKRYADLGYGLNSDTASIVEIPE